MVQTARPMSGSRYEGVPIDSPSIMDVILSMMMKYGEAEERNRDRRAETSKRIDRERNMMQNSEWTDPREEMLLRNELAKAGPTSMSDIASHPSMAGVGASANGASDYMPATQPQLGMDMQMVSSHQSPLQPQAGPTPWQQFQQMNPNLDYDAVVRQAGGVPGSFPQENEWGGAISEMPDYPGREQKDQEFIDWVAQETDRLKFDSLSDPSRRTYDPAAAQLVSERESSKRDSAVREIYNRAQMVQAEAANSELEIMERQAEFSRSPAGQIESIANMLLQNADPVTGKPMIALAARVKMALAQNDIAGAAKILEELELLTGKDQEKANESDDPVIG